jgi:hypothetical protein
MIGNTDQGSQYPDEDVDAWLDDIACKDLPIEAFFVQAGHIIDEEVLNVCRGCPVRIECITHAYDKKLNIIGGYFGGMSPGQRRTPGGMTLEQAIEFCKNDPIKVFSPTAPDSDPQLEQVIYE